jgi:endo-1,4-beta-D-glucanase Y
MMKKSLLLIVVGLLSLIGYAQINSGSPANPFGSKTSYSYGSMPNNLPTSGTYGASQAAADAYNSWKTNLTETCTNGVRVKYDTQTETVSEGIGYGMLLSAYAGDKALFDNLYKFYKANVNGNGLMNWHINGCSGNLGSNGATDADEDAAMALIIASNQWPTATSPYTYLTEATTLIGKIRQYEIHPTSYQAVNGDAWGFSSTCRNPSYFAPAYYREFAKIETSQATFWNNAVSAANTLLAANRNAITGLVCNWSDNNGASNNCNGNQEFGFDAIRNPWRMATDVIWNGTTTATSASDICSKMSTWMNGYESNLKIPCAMTASNPSVGTYKNGTASMMSLAMMGVSGKASNLGTAYSNTVNLGSNEAYFSQTLRCITLFMMTGNFWKPGTTSNVTPIVSSASTNGAGSIITVTFNTAISFSAADYSKITLKVGGTTVAGAITAITANGSNAVDLTIASGKIAVGNVITLDYTPGTIKSTASTPISLAAFTAKAVINNMAVNTLIADCENINVTKLNTPWYSYQTGTTTITPLSSATVPFKMTLGGANGTDSAAAVAGNLAKPAGPDYESAGIGFSFTNTTPTINTTTNLVTNESSIIYDLTGATGISFWHKGDAVNFSVMLSTVEVDKGKDYSFAVPSHTSWTLVEVLFPGQTGSQLLAQANWVTNPVNWNPAKVYRLQWQVKDGVARNYSFGIDEVSVMGKVLTLPVVTTVDKTLLLSTITSANTLYTSAVEGTATGNYQTGSKATLLTAITAATAVNTSTTATQADVDAAVVALNTAVTSFQSKIIGTNKTALVAAISNATTIYNAAVEGTALGQYPAPAKSNFNQDILAATLVNTTPTATQSQIDAAVITLNAAITAFQAKAVTTSSSTLIFTAEDLNATKLLTYWYSYKDAASTTVTPLSSSTVNFTMTAGGANGTANAAKINYTLSGETTLGYNPFAGMGFSMKDPEAAYDLTGSTGITFYYKSDNPLVLEINLTTIKDDCNFYVDLAAATSWTKKTLTWAQFAQYSTWGTKVTWDLTKMNKFQWKVQSTDGTTGNLWVDEVQIDGKVLTLPTTTVDKSVLATAITTANGFYSSAVEGAANGNYATGSKAILLTAITAATSVNTSTTATQADVDAALTALNTAVTSFQNKIVVVSKTALQSAITNANSLYSNATEGSAVGNYPTGSKALLQTAITAAMTVNTNSLATQAQVDAALTALNSAVSTFQNSIITVVAVDKSNLVSAIAAAQLLYGTSVEGSADGNYPTGSKATLMAAITAASTVNSNSSATQVQVNAALATLATAVLTFQNSVIGVNKTALIAEIAYAGTVLSPAVEGSASGQYPTGSKATLQSAIDAASAINTSSSVSQAQVNTAISTLNTAVTTFQNSVIGVNKTALTNAIATAQYYYDIAIEGTANGQYPSPAKANLLTALNTANAVLSSTTATQVQVNSAITTINNALLTFQSSVVGVNTATLQAKITEVNTVLVLESGNIGTAIGNYSQSSWDALSNTVKVAQLMLLNTTSATQVQIDATLTALDAAYTAFKNSKIATAVAEVSNKILNVYPIPCSDILHIESSKIIVNVTIVNILGVMQQRIDINESSLQLSVSALSNGFYFVEITNNDGTVETARITKE